MSARIAITAQVGGDEREPVTGDCPAASGRGAATAGTATAGSARRGVPLSEKLAAEVLSRLGLPGAVPITLGGLERVFATWCRNTGYDNIGLLIHLEAGGRGSVPGFPAAAYFRRWLDDGISNFCWANSEALCALLRHLGFSVSRAAGSMGATLANVKHGTAIASLDGQRYLIDPTFLAEHPLQLRRGHRAAAGDGPLRIWVDTDGTIRWQLPHGRFVGAFRLETTRCSFASFCAGHAETKAGLAHGRMYKNKLFVRRNINGGTLTYDGGVVIAKAGQHCDARRVAQHETAAFLIEDFGIAPHVVERIPRHSLW